MAWEDFLNHTCDIYHRQSAVGSVGFGLPTQAKAGYGDTPDVAGVPCHFQTNASMTVVQSSPQEKLAAATKLAVPIGTDVREGDKIVESTTGYEYTAGIPRQVRNHHVVVMLYRSKEQEAL